VRALHVPAPGARPVVGDLPIPDVVPGHVLVQVKAAGLNPFDNIVAAGLMAEMVPHEYPLVLGRDAAGIVTAVADDVDHVAVGDEGFGHVLFAPPVQAGTLAEYALLSASTVATKPRAMDFATAAAIPLAGAAASAAVDIIGPRPGQVVLVNGATGGVGQYAVQLLVARGAIVVATGTEAEHETLTALGAKTVVDYSAGSVVDQVLAAHPDGVDALVNLVGSATGEIPLQAVRREGTVATTTMAPDADTLSAAGLAGSTVRAIPVAQTTGPLAELAAAGTLRVDIDTVLPLGQATEGLARLAAGTARGKIVVAVSE
jgi:NADPH:quinone reductase-like Zn-dependent oxidoreductase